MATDNLQITEVATNQANKEQTINTGLNALDNATQGSLEVAFSGSSATVSGTNFRRYLRFVCTGLTGDSTLNVPSGGKRLFLVTNTHASYLITVDCGGTTVSVPAVSSRLIYCDGTDLQAPSSDVSGTVVSSLLGMSGDLSLTDLINAGLAQSETVRLVLTADVASTVNISGTYANGASGVGATLTTFADGPLVVDGVSLVDGDVVLVKSQTSGLENGLYTVTHDGTGSPATPVILTRSTSMDTAAEFPRAAVEIQGGSTQSGWVMNCENDVNPTVGTTAISWTRLTSDAEGPPFYIATHGTADLDRLVVMTLDTFLRLHVGGSNGQVLGRASGTWGAQSLSSLLDAAAGSAQGDILYRSGASWTALTPGTNGYVLTTHGAGSNPTWAAATASVEWNAGVVDVLGTGLDINGSPATITADWQGGLVTSLGTGISLVGGVLSAVGSGGSVTDVETGPGLSGGPISTSGTITAEWQAGTVQAVGFGLAITGLSALTLEADWQAGEVALVGAGLSIAGSPPALEADWQGGVVTNLGAGLTLNLGTLTAEGTGVTAVVAGTGLSGGTITSTGTIALAAIATGRLLGNSSGGSTAPTAQVVGAGLSFNSGTLAAASNLVDTPTAVPFAGKPGAGAKIVIPIVNAQTVPANFSGSGGWADTAPTGASVAFTVSYRHSGSTTTIGTFTFTSGSNTPTLSTQAAVNLVAGDVLFVDAPAVQDATLANVAITLLLQKA